MNAISNSDRLKITFFASGTIFILGAALTAAVVGVHFGAPHILSHYGGVFLTIPPASTAIIALILSAIVKVKFILNAQQNERLNSEKHKTLDNI
ncbi:MAG: hypothetical protein KDK55_07230, partial [Chlamydiia bacterium]|nr:hypothetical protein [Chlamydiia bacterium]